MPTVLDCLALEFSGFVMCDGFHVFMMYAYAAVGNCWLLIFLWLSDAVDGLRADRVSTNPTIATGMN